MPSPAPRLSPLRIGLNLLGFAVGVALLVWIVHRAAQGDGWRRLADAPPGAVVALLACSVLSLLANGSAFWIAVRPERRLGWRDLQWLNAVASLLNYAPVRVGALLRIAYHVRIDQLTMVAVTVWFGLLGAVLLIALGVVAGATLLFSAVGWAWALAVVGGLCLGAALLRSATTLLPMVHAGIPPWRPLGSRSAVWGAMALRTIDIGAFIGRIAAAAAALRIDLAPSAVVLLGVVAMAASLAPFGRLGFREAAVALVATRLSLAEETVESMWAALAVVESMGELVVLLPAGTIGAWFVRRRWMAARTIAT